TLQHPSHHHHARRRFPGALRVTRRMRPGSFLPSRPACVSRSRRPPFHHHTEDRLVTGQPAPASPTANTDSRGKPILVADKVGRHFDTAEGSVIAVDDISFSVNENEFVSVIGPSGCGKSTLFNLIGGLLPMGEG